MDKVDVEEKKRMFELMKDRELGGNMDWMYRGGKPDTEEYLLGKSVDKMVSEATTTTTEEGAGSIFSERIKANVALDMQAKMREDPLFAIRKKEEDARRRLLENPVKMKQLEKLLEQQRQQRSKAAKKAKKEKKSKKKKKKKSHSSDSESSDSEDDLVNKYLTILTQKKKSGEAADASHRHKHREDKPKVKNGRGDQRSNEFHHRSRDDEHHRRRDDSHQRHSKKQRHERVYEHSESRRTPDGGSRGRSVSPAQKRRKKRSSSEEPEQENHKSLPRQDSSEAEVSKRVYGLIKTVRHNMGSADLPPQVTVKSEDIKRPRESSSSGSSRSRSRSPKRSAHRKDEKRHRSPVQQHRSHRKRSPSQRRSQSPVRKRTVASSKRQGSKSKSPPKKTRSRSPPKKKLTAEERERKLKEMMDDAKWRDEQRRTNVQRYRHEDEKEKDVLSTYKGDASFLSSMMSDHASSSSVEDRLKRNKYNIQRTRAALDKNFTQH